MKYRKYRQLKIEKRRREKAVMAMSQASKMWEKKKEKYKWNNIYVIWLPMGGGGGW